MGRLPIGVACQHFQSPHSFCPSLAEFVVDLLVLPFSCGTPVDGHSFVVSASASHCLLVGSEQWRRLALGIVTEP